MMWEQPFRDAFAANSNNGTDKGMPATICGTIRKIKPFKPFSFEKVCRRNEATAI
jgi:hypothetical protein